MQQNMQFFFFCLDSTVLIQFYSKELYWREKVENGEHILYSWRGYTALCKQLCHCVVMYVNTGYEAFWNK